MALRTFGNRQKPKSMSGGQGRFFTLLSCIGLGLVNIFGILKYSAIVTRVNDKELNSFDIPPTEHEDLPSAFSSSGDGDDEKEQGMIFAEPAFMLESELNENDFFCGSMVDETRALFRSTHIQNYNRGRRCVHPDPPSWKRSERRPHGARLARLFSRAFEQMAEDVWQ